ncbi:hypothetical protein COCON_G00180230 [Conger conger]|uniref:Uncharacterized protein n=1 Tax=Conger conger TaxID=82655 RepID=A0A9Q1D5L1_CONCO|nr:hypothetical protein COCON_G00180230 [Conger conger]
MSEYICTTPKRRAPRVSAGSRARGEADITAVLTACPAPSQCTVSPRRTERNGQAGRPPIMDFIKTLTKGSKEPEGTSKPEKEQKSLKMEKNPPTGGAAQAPSEPKEQDPTAKESGSTFSKIFRQKSLKDNQPAATSVAQEGDPAAANKAGKAAPPPEVADSKAKAPMKKELPKVTLGVPSPGKDSAFSKFFRPKVDPSKANTLEASSSDKAAKQEGKKAEKSRLASCFKCGTQSPKPQ